MHLNFHYPDLYASMHLGRAFAYRRSYQRKFLWSDLFIDYPCLCTKHLYRSKSGILKNAWTHIDKFAKIMCI